MTNTARLMALCDELLLAASKATPGQWQRSGVRQTINENCIMVGPDDFLIVAIPVGKNPKEHAGAFNDAGFIAAACPAAVAELARYAKDRLAAESAGLTDRNAAIEAALPALRRALTENWRDVENARAWDHDILLTGATAAKYEKPKEAADLLARYAVGAVYDAIISRLAQSPAPVQGWRPVSDDDKRVNAKFIYWNVGKFVSSCDWIDGDEDHTEGWWDDAITEYVEPVAFLCRLPEPPQPAQARSDSDDEQYAAAVAHVLAHQKASTSFIQRHLQIGYNRAARILERMVSEGIVSEPDNVGKRTVLRPAAEQGEK